MSTPLIKRICTSVHGFIMYMCTRVYHVHLYTGVLCTWGHGFIMYMCTRVIKYKCLSVEQASSKTTNKKIIYIYFFQVFCPLLLLFCLVSTTLIILVYLGTKPNQTFINQTKLLQIKSNFYKPNLTFTNQIKRLQTNPNYYKCNQTFAYAKVETNIQFNQTTHL